MSDTFEGKLLGVIEGCTHPESAELLDDGETIVFGNCALSVSVRDYRDGAGIVYLQNEAFVSRARIDSDGRVSLEERRLLTGLTATLGCDILRVGTGRFPAGTVFIVEGGLPITADGESLVSSSSCRVLGFDPMTGGVVGEIPLWEGSAIGRAFNGLDQPNGFAIDAAGNFYVGDIPNSNPDPDPAAPARVPSAVYRIPHEDLDALAAGEDAAAGVRRVIMAGNVNGVCISPIDGSCWAVSCSPFDPVKGGLYNLNPGAFESGVQPEPLVTGLGILDGVGATRRGTVLASNPVTSEVHAFTVDGRHMVVMAEGNPVRMPADFNVVYPSALAGEPALLLTDIGLGTQPGSNAVAVVDVSGL